jgi:hypothetical protein
VTPSSGLSCPTTTKTASSNSAIAISARPDLAVRHRCGMLSSERLSTCTCILLEDVDRICRTCDRGKITCP